MVFFVLFSFVNGQTSMYKPFWERRWAGKGLLGEWGEGRGLQFLAVTYLTSENRGREEETQGLVFAREGISTG